MIYLTLFLEFFKIGLFCFGGAFGMIPLIEETVLRHEWMTKAEFYNFIGVCESTPGPIAVNMATFIGAGEGGLLGSITATLGVVLPSFLIILLIASVLKHLTENKWFSAFMQGVKPVIVALILTTGLALMFTALGGSTPLQFSLDAVSAVIVLLLVLISFAYQGLLHKKLPAVMLIAISATLGVLVSVAAELMIR